MDASKAFDRVKHDKRFILLIERGVQPIIIRTLCDSYKRWKLQVRWNGSLPSTFRTKNGIKQESIMSPVLFTVYMDELLSRLEKVAIDAELELIILEVWAMLISYHYSVLLSTT